ncbi:armadillo-type protein [Mycena galericulata]|nr:armadillo-type protein [Mycena galericulata]
MLAQVATHDLPAVIALGPRPCLWLVSLLRDENDNVIEAAMFALSSVMRSEYGAQVAVDAGVLDHVMELLNSQNRHTPRWTSSMLGHLACHSFASELVLALKPHENEYVVENAIFALSVIAEFRDGAASAVDEKILDRVIDLLHSTNGNVRRWACKALGNLAHHKSTASAVLAANPVEGLASCVQGDDLPAIENAAFALSEMTRWTESLVPVLETKVLDYAVKLLESRDMTRKWTCWIVGHLAHHESTAATVLEVNPSAEIASLLGDKDKDVLDSAIFALSEIISHPEGAKVAAVTANVLTHMMGLLDSPHVDAQSWVCKMLGKLAHDKDTAPAVLEVKPCAQLVAILRSRDPDDVVFEDVIYALGGITAAPGGAQDAADATAAECILESLTSSVKTGQDWKCRMLGNLAHYKSTAMAVLELEPCAILVSLLPHPNVAVRAGAIFALAEISQWPDGSVAVASTDVLMHISALLEDSHQDMEFHACVILRNLVHWGPVCRRRIRVDCLSSALSMEHV